MATLEIEKLTPHIGAVIHGMDLAGPLDADTFHAVHDALMDNLVVFFRDQRITVDQQKDFGRRFGELHIHPQRPVCSRAIRRSSSSTPTRSPSAWPARTGTPTCRAIPSRRWAILHMEELPPVGGDTLFASMYAAYETLSEEMQRFLCGFTAIHDGEHVYRGRYGVRRHRAHLSARRAPGDPRAPGDGAARALRQSRVHDAHRPAQAGGVGRSCSSSSTVTSRRRSSTAGSGGRATRSPSGTTAAPSTTPCGTTTRSAGTATG